MWRLLLLVVLVGLSFIPQSDMQIDHSLTAQADRLTQAQAFHFSTWEIQTLTQKALLAMVNPQRFMDDEQRSRFMLRYLRHVGEAKQLDHEIATIYADAQIKDPQEASQDKRAELANLRARLARESLLAEAILGEQVSQTLRQGGFGLGGQILPPVAGKFTPLPYMVILSPRDHIESVYQRSLVTGMTAADQAALEQKIEQALPEYSAYVTAIGGLSAYPAMMLESDNLDWVTDTMAHEWTHHYLLFHPLGWYYERDPQTRTINETTASLIGEWAGQEIVLRDYAGLYTHPKSLPDPLRAPEPQNGQAAFDFNKEMYETRLVVDSLLAQGQITTAERLMELERQAINAHGYHLRRLNQAYFAFHGAYASTPGGAAGKDPLGPAVRELWDISATPQAFVHAIAPVTTLAQLQAVNQSVLAKLAR